MLANYERKVLRILFNYSSGRRRLKRVRGSRMLWLLWTLLWLRNTYIGKTGLTLPTY
ncbi:hypothetical protein OM416_03100 [Paenibacillus sp. LS1]|uniref:hypothetical protein n=1 Tax=Paenibacillus sp. LS1 TaxID=2992120 RepID=UPI002230C26C|nr:hypothetical protein [Paenibacillus sp. LS1]MCW3790550.1 hypothetical protein [Paenibacillus sp. LS1]